MKQQQRAGELRLRRRARDRYGLFSRAEAVAEGFTRREIAGRLSRDDWLRVHPGVFCFPGAPDIPEQRILAACIAAGPAAAASHQSAAWLWGLLDRMPVGTSVVVRSASRRRVKGAYVHRTRDLDRRRVRLRKGIWCTDPARTLLDLGAVAPAPIVERAVDVALARRLVDVDALLAEIDEHARQGRNGAGVLRSSLERRGLLACPAPSVLESEFCRLLRRLGVEPLSVETPVEGGRFRLDSTLAPGLAAEVSGYSYHSSAEQLQSDAARHNALLLQGFRLLIFTWRDVLFDGERVGHEIRVALDLLQHEKMEAR